MKRLVLLVLLVPVLLSSCFIFGPGYEDWNGDLEGIEGLYDITVEQSGSDLIIKVRVNDAAYGELLADLDEGEEFVPPSELFFWMAPVFENSIEDYNYIYPVARKRITDAFFADSNNDGDNDNPEISVTVKLSKLAADWNIHWLETYRFDGDGGDDMSGVYVFAADNYTEFNEWQFTDIPLKEGGIESFKFEKSRPIGLGYSLADAIIDEWTPVTLSQDGLYIDRYYVFGGSAFEITLKIPENESFGAPLNLPTESGSYPLDENNTYEVTEEGKRFVWRIIYEPQGYGQTVDGENVIHVAGPWPGWYSFDTSYGWMWYSVNFEYKGYANELFSTGFEDSWNLTGYGGGSLTRDTIAHPDAGYIVSPESNNWTLGALPSTVKLYGNVSETVLGLGAGGDITQPYDYYRNDVIEFPAYDYYSEYQGAVDAIYVVFNLYKNLSMDWWDALYLEIERKVYYASNNLVETYWDTLASWTGPVDLYYNNGWEDAMIQIYDYNTGNYDQYWDTQSGEQKLRLRFYSNSWSNAEGVYIDNLQVLLVGGGV